MRTHLSAVLASVAGAAVLLAGAAPASAVAETNLKPGRLDRGSDIAGPHVEGKTVVDGEVRVRIKAGMVILLGKSGDEYVVGTTDKNGDHSRTFRVTADGDRTPLVRNADVFEMELSSDGSRIGLATGRTGARSRMRVWSTVDGHREVSRQFPGSVSILDFGAKRMVLGSWGPNRTFWWNVNRDRTHRIAARTGYRASIAADRFAFFTKDPYNGGCSVTARLSDQHRLWRSCHERVEAFAPSGGRTAAVHILSDGLGATTVRVHKGGGKVLARYTTDGWFGALTWESRHALLLETHGSTKTAVVRCVLSDCERATDLSNNPSYRVSPRERLAARP